MRTLLYIYGIMSLVTLVAYAVDKNAAIRGKWRIAESSLHAPELGAVWYLRGKWM